MKTYLITGASSGIGMELARACVGQQHRVYGLARRKDLLEKLADELGENFTPFVCDVTDKPQVQAVCDALPNVPDIAILNAGIAVLESLTTFEVQNHESTFSVNYFGALNFIDALFPKFAERKSGAFVGISSIASYRGLPESAAYCASKAALSTAFESMGAGYQGLGIDFLAVHPGFVRTPMTVGKGFPMPLAWDADKAASYILRKIDTRTPHIAFPMPMRVLMRSVTLIPAPLYRWIMNSAAKRNPPDVS
jgi:short-subunit dehydrogenase